MLQAYYMMGWELWFIEIKSAFLIWTIILFGVIGLGGLGILALFLKPPPYGKHE